MDYIEAWDLEVDEINQVLSNNPSLRGMMQGYLAEEVLKNRFLNSHEEIRETITPDDHDRVLNADLLIDYRGQILRVEVTSLQSDSVERECEKYEAKGKINLSNGNKKEVSLPNGTKLETTYKSSSDFDLLAVSTFEFDNEWDFVFSTPGRLPKLAERENDSKFNSEEEQFLLESDVEVTKPRKPPFSDNLSEILSEASCIEDNI